MCYQPSPKQAASAVISHALMKLLFLLKNSKDFKSTSLPSTHRPRLQVQKETEGRLEGAWGGQPEEVGGVACKSEKEGPSTHSALFWLLVLSLPIYSPQSSPNELNKMSI